MPSELPDLLRQAKSQMDSGASEEAYHTYSKAVLVARRSGHDAQVVPVLLGFAGALHRLGRAEQASLYVDEARTRAGDDRTLQQLVERGSQSLSAHAPQR